MSRHRRGRHRKPITTPPFLKAGLAVAMTCTLWAAFTVDRSTWTPPVAAAALPTSALVVTTRAPVPIVTSESVPTTTLTPSVRATTTRAPAPPTTTTTTTTRPPTTTRAPESSTPAVETPEPPQETHSNVVAAARSYLGDGIPYIWGGKTLRGMDCSGYIWNVLKNAGYDVPYRTSSALKVWADPVSASNVRAGDFVFFPGHVGLYLGDGRLIDMARSTGTVTERAVWSGASYGRIP